MVRGSCLCGGVAFEIDGKVTAMHYCHAARCRKATGAAFATELAANASDLRWTKGEDLITIYDAPVLREPPAYRHAFCRVCGSSLPATLEGTPYVALHAGTLDDDPTTRPFRHIFVSQRAPWHTISDDMPQHEQHAPAGERLPRGRIGEQ